jgi:hypothetical protein
MTIMSQRPGHAGDVSFAPQMPPKAHTVEVTRITRLHHPSRADFNDKVRSNTPVVVTGATTAETLQAWQLPHLVDRIGDYKCRVARSATKRYRYGEQEGLVTETMPFSKFVDLAFRGNSTDHCYLQDDIRSFPPLLEFTGLPSELSRPKITQAKLWVSAAESITSLHYDPVETILWQLVGSKRFILFPPGVREYYPYGWKTKSSFLSQVSIDDPDYQRFPLFRNAIRHEIEVCPGDLIYVPLGWWHEVHSIDPINISVNYRWFAPLLKTLKNWRQFTRTAPVIIKSLRAIRAQRVS